LLHRSHSNSGGHWFNPADNAVEEALYDIARLRRFVGIELGGRVAGITTALCTSPLWLSTPMCSFRPLVPVLS
jgi:hypothetical protein